MSNDDDAASALRQLGSPQRSVGIQLPCCVSLEFGLHTLSAMGASVVLMVFDEHASPQRGNDDDEVDGTQRRSCLRPMPLSTSSFVDGQALYDELLTPNQRRGGATVPPFPVVAHDPGRRLFLLLQHSEAWASAVVADIAHRSVAARTVGGGVSSVVDGRRLLAWTRTDVDAIRRRWQLAVFLGVPACVFPALPTVEDRSAAPQDTILTLEDIAKFLWDCVTGAASASSREAQCWLPFPLLAGGDDSTSAYILWRQFREVLQAVAANVSGLPHVTSHRCLSLVRPILRTESTTSVLRHNDGDVGTARLWLGEDVAALLPSGDSTENGTPTMVDPQVEAPLLVADDDQCGSCHHRVSGPCPIWGGIGPYQNSCASLLSNRKSLSCLTLCRNLVARGAIPFAPIVAEHEAHVARHIAFHTASVQRYWDDLSFLTAGDARGWHAGDQQLVAHLAQRAHAVSPLADQLQVPLQPLGDHLDGGVYQTFEEDRPKYQQYYLALRAYFADCKHDYDVRPHQGDGGAGGDGCAVTVMVLGAGRGPLVTECLLAATDEDVRVHVVAVEKNPAAVQYLRAKLTWDPAWTHLQELCGHTVTIVEGDGRNLASTSWGEEEQLARVRCVVSELLGSAGDNELSPECIDGTLRALSAVRAQHPSSCSMWLPSEVVSIPSEVHFYAAPVQSATLAQRIRSCRVREASNANELLRSPPDTAGGPLNRGDACKHTVFVSHIVQGVLLAEPQRVWSFLHAPTNVAAAAPGAHSNCGDTASSPSSAAACASSVFGRGVVGIRFAIPPHGRVDVLGGYFTALLYAARRLGDGRDGHDAVQPPGESDGKSVLWLSTLPASWTPPGMYSWFPCVFPVLGGVGRCRSGDMLAGASGGELAVEFLRGVAPSGVYTSWRTALSQVVGADTPAAAAAAAHQLCEQPWEWHNEGGWAAMVRV